MVPGLGPHRLAILAVCTPELVTTSCLAVSMLGCHGLSQESLLGVVLTALARVPRMASLVPQVAEAGSMRLRWHELWCS